MGLSGHRKGFSRILGSSEQSVKMSLPLGVGGGGGSKRTIHATIWLVHFSQ